MDMNWQAMLHEAANASFEKDIEVRSAADDDAYSCIVADSFLTLIGLARNKDIL